jgi:hypothetical protein
VDEVVREFADACRKLFVETCQRFADEIAAEKKAVPRLGDEYRDVPGFPGYRVNARGRVQTCWQMGGGCMTTEWRTLRPFFGDGRRRVRLSRKGKLHEFQVGVLVLRAWVGEPPSDKPYVRHINRRVDIDRLENLEWSAYRQYRYGRRAGS